jgi:hypothetical protein
LLIDRDPSGVTMARTVERELRGFLPPDFPLTIELLAVTEQQIVDWHLPTRRTKREGNTHAKDFVGDSVELDALERASLMELATDGWLEEEVEAIDEAVALSWGREP